MPWDPAALKPIFDQLIPAAEDLSVKQITSRAEKARLPADLLREIESDSKWPALAKKGLEMSAPKVTAKLLNMTGVSAEHQDFVVLGTSLATIISSHALLLRKLDKLIATQTAAAAAKPNDSKTEKTP
jgi:hypothetical protein